MVFNRKDCKITWNPITPKGENVHFKDYLFQVYTSAYTSAMAEPGTGATYETYLDDPFFEITHDFNKSLFGTAQAHFFVQVKGHSIYDTFSSSWAFATAVNHIPPATPGSLLAYPGLRNMLFEWTKCTASDFSHYAIRTHEGTAAFGSWEDYDMNALVVHLTADSDPGDSISLEVKVFDVYNQESNAISASDDTLDLKTADAQSFRIKPTDSLGTIATAMHVLFDGDLDSNYLTYTGGDWVQYEYPVEYVMNSAAIWHNVNFNMYLSYYDENEEVWKFFSGNASHELSGGALIEYSTEATAQTNYYTTEKDSYSRTFMPFPIQRQFEKIKLNKYGGTNINLYEWKNNVFLLADEIVGGVLKSQNWTETGATGGSYHDLNDGTIQLRDTLSITAGFYGNVVDGSKTITGIDTDELSMLLVGDLLYGTGIVTGAEISALYDTSFLMTTAADASTSTASLEAVGERTRKVFMGSGYGLKSLDAKDQIVHDVPNTIIASDMTYGGHLFFKDTVDYISSVTAYFTDTNTNRIEDGNLTNVDLAPYLPEGLTNARGVFGLFLLDSSIAYQKLLNGSLMTIGVRYSFEYNQTPNAFNIIAQFTEKCMNPTGSVDFILGTRVQGFLPIVYDGSNNPFMTWTMRYTFAAMDNVNDDYHAYARFFLQGFFV